MAEGDSESSTGSGSDFGSDSSTDNSNAESLTLGDALKLSGLVDTGGHAKGLIQGGLVKVNGQVERRRKRRVGHGDEIEVAGELFVVEAQDGPSAGD
ncbi:MAG: RNA-binding S4 domain-containing protein [Trueperaceae bacterium]